MKSFQRAISKKDLNLPAITPWVFKEFATTTKVFERNPYYWKVGTAGNQLPYIDRVIVSIIDKEVYHHYGLYNSDIFIKERNY